jgi:hypothetical protein
MFKKNILKRYTCSSQYKDAGRAKELKSWDSSVCRKSFAVPILARLP